MNWRFSIFFLAILLTLSLQACGDDEDADADAGDTDSGDTDSDADTSDDTGDDTGTDTGDDTGTETGDDTGTDSGGDTETSDQCNDLVNIGTDVVLTSVGGAVPTGTGGTVTDGTYVLSDLSAYDNIISETLVGTLTLNQTIEISGGGTHSESVADDNDKPHFTKSGDIATDGNTIVFTNTCSTEVDDSNMQYDSYTATATSLTLYANGLGLSVTFTMQ